MNREQFTEFIKQIQPHVEQISEIAQKEGRGISFSISADGYIHMFASGVPFYASASKQSDEICLYEDGENYGTLKRGTPCEKD